LQVPSLTLLRELRLQAPDVVLTPVCPNRGGLKVAIVFPLAKIHHFFELNQVGLIFSGYLQLKLRDEISIRTDKVKGTIILSSASSEETLLVDDIEAWVDRNVC